MSGEHFKGLRLLVFRLYQKNKIDFFQKLVFRKIYHFLQFFLFFSRFLKQPGIFYFNRPKVY